MGLFSLCKGGSAEQKQRKQKQQTQQLQQAQIDPSFWPPKEQRIEYPKKQTTDISKVRIEQQQNKQFIRRYGDLNNSELRLEDLSNCVVLVTDNCKAVSIDQCNNCQFIICTCQGSIFMRDCKSVRIAAITAQFRTRDCYDCAFYLHSLTDPVIEATERVKFFPFMFSMASQQFDEETQQILIKEIQKTILATKISVFLNQYHKVYNFTPQKTSYEVLELPVKNVKSQLHPPLFINLEDQYTVPEGFINQTSNYTQTGGIPLVFGQKDVLPYKQIINADTYLIGPLQAFQLLRLNSYVMKIIRDQQNSKFSVTIASEGQLELEEFTQIIQ